MTDTTDLDPEEIAAKELAEGMVPMPEDFIPAMSPFAALYYTWKVLGEVLPVWVAHLAGPGAEDLGDGGELIPALDAISQASGLIIGACQMINLLPPGDIDAI